MLLCEPSYWGRRLAVMDFVVEETRSRRGRGWRLVAATSQVLNSNTVAEDARVARAVREQHDTVVAYVNSPVGTSTAALSAARAVVEDVPIIDFVNYVQADAVKAGLTGADAALPVLSIAAPFNRAASFPAGQVTVRDVAGLYIYDNTLLGVRVTGADVKAYLEFSARYFKQVSGTGPFTMDQVTNAVTPTAPNGTPDYNFDSVAGLDAPLTYDIDIAAAPGSRIVGLAYGGVPVTDAQQFVLAVNNYRQSGGGGFPAVSTAPVVYNRQNEIRQLLIDWVTAHGTIDPAAFASVDWRLVVRRHADHGDLSGGSLPAEDRPPAARRTRRGPRRSRWCVKRARWPVCSRSSAASRWGRVAALIAFLMPLWAIAGPAASRRASLATRSGNSSSGATWVIRPHVERLARRVIGSPSRAIRMARARPIEAATVADEPPSVISPIRGEGQQERRRLGGHDDVGGQGGRAGDAGGDAVDARRAPACRARRRPGSPGWRRPWSRPGARARAAATPCRRRR